MNFREFLKLGEDTTSADVASVPTTLNLVQRPKTYNGKGKCPNHGIMNCKPCIGSTCKSTSSTEETGNVNNIKSINGTN